MRQTFIYKPGDIRVENVPDPGIVSPTDAIIRIVATCVCGYDLWDDRGINPVGEPHPIGLEYAGVVEEIGGEVSAVKPGQFVIGSFFASDGTCPICRAGYQTSCLHREFINGCQAELARIPLADGTLVATAGQPSGELIPSLLALSDVMGTGCTRPSRPRSSRARPSRSSVTARSACVRSSRPGNWVPSGSSP